MAPFRGRLLVCRESAAVREVVAASALSRVRWDRRFVIEAGAGLPTSSCVAALGAAGWAKVAAACPERLRAAIPSAVRVTLPAFFHAENVLAVPHLGYSSGETGVGMVVFAPDIPISSFGRPLASWRWNAI